jgi:CheY-like chemotaxis protein
MMRGIAVNKNKTILVVEDDEAVREFIRLVLEDLGYRVIVAQDGQEGLDVYRQHQSEIAMVISDVVMPGMDGIELVCALRKLNPLVKCLLVSGYTTSRDIEGLGFEGLVGFVQKPFSIEAFAHKVEYTLTGGLPVN